MDLVKNFPTKKNLSITTTRQWGIAVVGNQHRALLGGVGIELASYSF